MAYGTLSRHVPTVEDGFDVMKQEIRTMQQAIT